MRLLHSHAVLRMRRASVMMSGRVGRVTTAATGLPKAGRTGRIPPLFQTAKLARVEARTGAHPKVQCSGLETGMNCQYHIPYNPILSFLKRISMAI